MDEKSIDAKIKINARRSKMLDRHIAKMNEKRQSVLDEKVFLEASKSEIVMEKQRAETTDVSTSK
jgi:hypothetical protein